MGDPTFDQLKARLIHLLMDATRFVANVYRSTTPLYASESELLAGEGSKRNGGRWNPVGTAVVYASLNPQTAMAETLAHNRYYGIAPEEAMPRTFVSIEVNLHAVLDFRQGVVRQRLRVSQDRILTVDWRKAVHAGQEPITQAIGRAAFAVGFEGMIVPSAVDPKFYNLLVFPTNLRPHSRLRVLHPERLSK